MNQHQFRIHTSNQRQISAGIMSLAVFAFSLLFNAFVPSLLLRYVYADQLGLTQPPAVLEYIPIATFLVTVGVFLYAVWVWVSTTSKLKYSYKMLKSNPGCNCMDGNCTCDSSSDLDELEKMVDMAITDAKAASKTSRKKRKTSKK